MQVTYASAIDETDRRKSGHWLRYMKYLGVGWLR
ncbi:hypothetical protein Vsou_21710 [Vulcanisaeta souniana JCM 11219]|uniref:Uncharacterized protein n=1 Tax=Vulcanisaeta souniana JCM 11219 TaxID=1293586 RepID=A0ABN6ST72_9CREN|nr:hypothetical protein Vsou_21710 [Vulcanisaeta souniana JCM 11219]